MKAVHLNSPGIRDWHVCFTLYKNYKYFMLGVRLSINPFVGPEDSEVMLTIFLPYLDIYIGIENNPYCLW